MKYSNDPMHPLLTPEEIVQACLIKNAPTTALPTIKEFYAGQEIFITGGSGFMGKVLIEKLLRSCPDIKTIYILLRPKKGKTVQERLRAIVDLPLFDVLRALKPDFHKKLFPIAGDVSELKLGLSEENYDQMKNVSVVFHSAASVRFDDSIKYAVLMNTRGTREVMKFAEHLKNIRLVMHVSTTYSNVYVHTVEEKIYPPAADWKKTIEICEKFDEDQLNYLTQHYINFMPNTYVFSKNLAEHVTNSYKDKLPVVLFRPSVVVGALKEPLPGWVDNFNGPMGILLASILGISKTMYCDPKNTLDLLPVDVCCKAMIIASWKRAHEPRESFTVYNCAAGNKIKITIEQLLDIGIHGICHDIPMEHMIWPAGGGVTLNKPLNFVRLIFYQIIPAIVLDMGLKMRKQKPRLLNLQRKMYEANQALTYFVTNNWDFKNDNLMNLSSILREEDVRDFDFQDAFHFDIVLLIRYIVLGFRRFLMKEKDETLPKCRKTYKRLVILNNFVKTILYLVAFYFLFTGFNLFNLVKDYFDL